MAHEYWKVTCKNEDCKVPFNYEYVGYLQEPIALRRCVGSIETECPHCKQIYTYGDNEIRLLPGEAPLPGGLEA